MAAAAKEGEEKSSKVVESSRSGNGLGLGIGLGLG